ncbi:MAG TPA: response regulator transcription factor [Bryobacteraceae bacterium]|nr:response regulator transcription factor [Bryobacteraceae bacterium]
MSRVLIVDDEPAIVIPVRDELAFEGLEVACAEDGPSGLKAALEMRPDVLLLDVMLPGMNGFDICRKLRPELPEMWIILLTVRGQEVDRVTGFEAGADDYVVKPFSLRELMARVRVGLRRKTPANHQRVYKFGDVEIDLRSRTVKRTGRDVPVTRKEFEILALLARRPGEVIPRDEFCDLIWGPDVFVTQRVIDTHIASLRKKIEPEPDEPQHIFSVRGVGYKLG